MPTHRRPPSLSKASPLTPPHASAGLLISDNVVEQIKQAQQTYDDVWHLSDREKAIILGLNQKSKIE